MPVVKNTRGDTLIEVLFAMTIIGVVLAAAYAVASRNLQVSQLAKERTQATELAVSQIDQLKALEVEPVPLGSEPFCLDVTRPVYILNASDPLCTVNGFRRSIVKIGSQYKVSVQWVPPGGSESNLSIVEFFYSDYDFSMLTPSPFLGSNTIEYGRGYNV